MKSIFLLQWQRFRRAPKLVLSFFAMTLLFVFFLAGIESENQITVYTYSDASLSEEARDTWLAKLNESEAFHFKNIDESEARKAVEDGEISLALQLMEEDYRILVTVNEQTRSPIESQVNLVFREELRLREVEELGVNEDFRAKVEQSLAEPALSVNTTSLEGNERSYADDERLQRVFGMTLYFSIYTIMFSLMNVAEEKRVGTWNRIIVSPLRKWQIYLGHLLYCFTVGYAQIVAAFLFFKFVLGLDLGSQFGAMLVAIGCYVFAIVALGVLLIGLVKTPQQLQAVIPICATAIAMIGGAFWPIEVVSNEVMLALSKGMPILYGLDALKGIALFDHGLIELAWPLSFMLLFGVLCMGIGINLMERRS